MRLATGDGLPASVSSLRRSGDQRRRIVHQVDLSASQMIMWSGSPISSDGQFATQSDHQKGRSVEKGIVLSLLLVATTLEGRR